MTLSTTANRKRTIHEINSISVNQSNLQQIIKQAKVKKIDQNTINKLTKIKQTLASTNGTEIFEIVKNDFKSLCDDQVYHLLTRNDLEPRIHQRIKYTLWAWANISEYDEHKLKSICKNQDIKYDNSDFFFHQTHNTYEYENSMFCCAGDPIYLVSDKMLDKALNMKSLNQTDLMFLMDNYITGQGKINNLDVTFDTYARRNEVFMHPTGVGEVNSFIRSCIYQYESKLFKLPDSYVAQNSIKRMIGKDLNDDNVKGFISPEAAQIGYQDIIDSYKVDKNKDSFISNIIHSPFIFTHKNAIKHKHKKYIANLLSKTLFNANRCGAEKKYQVRLIKNIFHHIPELIEKIDNDALCAHTKFLLN